MSENISGVDVTYIETSTFYDSSSNTYGSLTYKISQNAAFILGTDKEDTNKIQEEIKMLYRIRSKIVHSGKLDVDFIRFT